LNRHAVLFGGRGNVPGDVSWLTVLRKRPGFREAFSQFDIDAVAGFTEADVERLAADPGIVRHRARLPQP
jgi:DNA-3-methyladenine glycosylase I